MPESQTIQRRSYPGEGSSSGWTLVKRYVVFIVMRRQTFVILALLLICTIAAALLECQVHAESSADEHAAEHGQAPPRSHHGSSPHATGHGTCLLAVLSTALFLVWFTCVWFQVSPRLVCLTSPAFPPFIPPRAAAQ